MQFIELLRWSSPGPILSFGADRNCCVSADVIEFNQRRGDRAKLFGHGGKIGLWPLSGLDGAFAYGAAIRCKADAARTVP
jgi:hypothetical protein